MKALLIATFLLVGLLGCSPKEATLPAHSSLNAYRAGTVVETIEPAPGHRFVCVPTKVDSIKVGGRALRASGILINGAFHRSSGTPSSAVNVVQITNSVTEVSLRIDQTHQTIKIAAISPAPKPVGVVKGKRNFEVQTVEWRKEYVFNNQSPLHYPMLPTVRSEHGILIVKLVEQGPPRVPLDAKHLSLRSGKATFPCGGLIKLNERTHFFSGQERTVIFASPPSGRKVELLYDGKRAGKLPVFERK